MNVDYTICITTFSKRFSYLEKLLNQIRSFTDKDILIAINGDYKKKFNNEYRSKILELCNSFDNIYPIFFPEQRGMSKLWNTLIVHSKTDWCFILNDDVEITSDNIFQFANNKLDDNPEIYRINGWFSHFFIHKSLIDDLGYFDERYLGFGEEDHDIFFRYIEKYNRWLPDFFIGGIHNLITLVIDEGIQTIPGGKYTLFNRTFSFNQENPKYVPDPNGIKGTFGTEMRKNLPDTNAYPYERFFQENKYKI